MAQKAGVQLASDNESSSHHQPPSPLPQSNNNSVASQAKKPKSDLLTGPKEEYLKIGVPLYEAAIKCNWKAAITILEKNKDLVRSSITENEETALHVAASATSKDVEEFVGNLLEKMEKGDLELVSKDSNTALYLAAKAGNVETIKIMMKKNKILPTISGAGEMLPLNVAALFGKYDVVKYLYQESKGLSDDCWNIENRPNRRWLLEHCVENDMFDIALDIVTRYQDLGRNDGTILGILAGKPKPFNEVNSNIIGKTIKLSKHLYSMFITHKSSENKHMEPSNGSSPKDLSQKHGETRETKSNFIRKTIMSVFTSIGSKVGAYDKENQALPLLRIIWKDIAKKSKKEIDIILRGKRDSVKQDKSSGRMVQAIQLQELIARQVDKLKCETQNVISGQPNSTAQHTNPDHARQLKNLISKYVVNMQIEYKKIVDNMPAVGEGDLAMELQKLISEHLLNIYNEAQKENQAQHLQKIIYKNIEKMRDPTTLRTFSSRVLFIAAEVGNTNFLIELIRLNPDLIWKKNDNGLSIFHIAVKFRHEGIYNLLYEIGAMKDLITPLKDEHDNNMLHLVGTLAKQNQLEDVSGVALQMQRELLWFEEVKKMIPPSYRDRKNRDGLTPHELFKIEHKDLATQSEKWMKGTASQCMVVAALIATIVFAAAFTVPGGYDQNNGFPFFHSKATFVVFVVADAISLFMSTASILIFLSILTSRYAESDFLDSLPKKLVSGLLTLFLSITTMTVAFGVSFFVLYHKGVLWMPILICVFGVVPVLLYIFLQHGLFIDIISSIFSSRYLFNPKKRVLYENPKV